MERIYYHRLIFCALSISYSHQLKEKAGDVSQLQDNHLDSVVEKRAALPIELIGLSGWKRLLKGVTPMETRSKTYRLYEKPGNFETAMGDFFSLRPKNVKQVEGKTLTGYVGHKELRLVENGDRVGYNRPTLDIIGLKTESGKYIDKIIYKSD